MLLIFHRTFDITEVFTIIISNIRSIVNSICENVVKYEKLINYITNIKRNFRVNIEYFLIDMRRIPSISTGVYRFPKELAAEIAVNTVEHFLKEDISIEEVIFISFNDDNYELYTNLLNIRKN